MLFSLEILANSCFDVAMLTIELFSLVASSLARVLETMWRTFLTDVVLLDVVWLLLTLLDADLSALVFEPCTGLLV